MNISRNICFIYLANDYHSILQGKNMKISRIIAEKAGWGIVLSDDFLKLEEEIRSYEANNGEEMSQTIKNITKSIKVGSNLNFNSLSTR